MRRRWRTNLTAFAAGLGLAVVLLPTLLMLASGAAELGTVFVGPSATGHSPWPRQLERLGTTLAFSGVTAAAALAMGLPAGVVLGRIRLPLHSLWAAAVMLPLVMPSYIVAWGWQRLLADLQCSAALGPGSIVGAAVVAAATLFPLVALPVAAQVANLDREAETAAVQIGGRLFAWRRVIVPALTPAWMAGVALVLLFAWRDWNITALWRIDTLTHAVDAQFESTVRTNRFALAAAQAWPLAGLGAVAVAALMWAERRHRAPLSVAWPSAASARWPRPSQPSGLVRGAAMTGLAGLLGVAALAPLLELATTTGTAAAIGQALGDAATLEALQASLETSALAAVVALAVFVPLGAMLPRLGLAAAVWSLALPVSVATLGLVGVVREIPPSWCNGRGPVALVHAALFGPIVARLVSQACTAVPRDLLEAAALVGLSPLAAWWRIVWPFAASSVAVGGALVFVFSLSDVAATVLVAPPGQMLASPRLYNLLHYGRDDSVAALCLWLALCAALPYAVVVAWFGRAIRGR